MAEKKATRKHKFTINLNDFELQTCRELAHAEGMPFAQWLRIQAVKAAVKHREWIAMEQEARAGLSGPGVGLRGMSQ